jgi:DNA-directed RNA polymerase subunit RPC12/RpoP
MSKIKNFYHDEISHGMNPRASLCRIKVTGLTCLHCQDEALERLDYDDLECTSCGKKFVISDPTKPQ